MTWSVCSYTNDYLPTHHPHSPPGNRNPLVFWHWLQINLKNAEHASPTAPARPLPLHLQHLHLESGWSYFFLKSKCFTLTVNASSRVSTACPALGFGLGLPDAPPLPPTPSVCLPSPVPLPPHSCRPSLPLLSFSLPHPHCFYWVLNGGFLRGLVGLFCKEKTGFALGMHPLQDGSAGWVSPPIPYPHPYTRSARPPAHCSCPVCLPGAWAPG